MLFLLLLLSLSPSKKEKEEGKSIDRHLRSRKRIALVVSFDVRRRVWNGIIFAFLFIKYARNLIIIRGNILQLVR